MLAGAAVGGLLWQSQKAMAAPVSAPVMETKDDQFQDGISLQAWQQSALTQAGRNPPLQTFQLTDPSHPGGDPNALLDTVYAKYAYDVTNNNGHVIDHIQNAGDFIVLQDNTRKNVVLENDLSTNQSVWVGQKTDLQYQYANPGWWSQDAQQVVVGGLNTPNQAGNFSGMNTYQ